ALRACNSQDQLMSLSHRPVQLQVSGYFASVIGRRQTPIASLKGHGVSCRMPAVGLGDTPHDHRGARLLDMSQRQAGTHVSHSSAIGQTNVGLIDTAASGEYRAIQPAGKRNIGEG